MTKEHVGPRRVSIRRLSLLLTSSGALLTSLLSAPTLGQTAELTGDTTTDTVVADPLASGPGEVYVVSGTDGSVAVTLTGTTDGDQFGYSVGVAGDLTADGFKDLIVGAPKKYKGWAYVFYGPFLDGGPLLITAADADMAFTSPDPDDFDFGEAVGQVSDLNADGIPELRIRAWFLKPNGQETAHTYILSGADGKALFRITGEHPFDPWEQVLGDVDGDGDVDQADLDIILANQGLAGAGLTSFDGDINGDGVVDMTDYNLADGNMGFNAFSGLSSAIIGCLTLDCLWDCDGILQNLAANTDPECRNPCNADSSCSYTISPTPLSGTPRPIEFDVVVTITVMPPGGEAATWTIMEGSELIEVLEIADTYFRFRSIDFGPVTINAWYFQCNNFCTLTIPLEITWIDSDSDGLPDSWEPRLGLDPNNPDTDGDGILDGDEDYDGDGLSNHDEWVYGTDPTNPDTDGDGVSDGQEVAQGSDPNDPSDGGLPPDPADLVDVTLQVGDHSGSHSELWLLRVGDIRFKAPGYGEVTPPTIFRFLAGQSYPIRLVHLGTNLGEGPDYDYTALVTPEAGACAIVDDPQNLLGVVNDDNPPPNQNYAAGKTATLILPKVDLRINDTEQDGDDFVVVTDPNAANRPFTSITLILEAGEPTEVWLTQIGAGQVSFDDDSPMLTPGTPTTIKMYGETQSIAPNDKNIQARLEGPTGPVCAEEDLTVITGIKVRFSGSFFFKGNNNDGYRVSDVTGLPPGTWPCAGDPDPLLWQNTPLPCENVGPPGAVLVEEGKFAPFQERWPVGPQRQELKVFVTGVKTFGPEVDLDGRDNLLRSGIPLQGVSVSGSIGRFIGDDCDGDPMTGNPGGTDDAVEPFDDLNYRFGTTMGLKYINSASTTVARIWTKIESVPDTTAADQMAVATIFLPGGVAGCTTPGTYMPPPTEPGMTYIDSTGAFQCQQDRTVRDLLLAGAGFRGSIQAAWANFTTRKLEITKPADFNNSFIARLFEHAILGHPNNTDADPANDVYAETFMQFGDYDWYNSQGNLSKGVATSPGGIDPAAFVEHIQADGCPMPSQPTIPRSDDPW